MTKGMRRPHDTDTDLCWMQEWLSSSRKDPQSPKTLFQTMVSKSVIEILSTHTYLCCFIYIHTRLKEQWTICCTISHKAGKEILYGDHSRNCDCQFLYFKPFRLLVKAWNTQNQKQLESCLFLSQHEGSLCTNESFVFEPHIINVRTLQHRESKLNSRDTSLV